LTAARHRRFIAVVRPIPWLRVVSVFWLALAGCAGGPAAARPDPARANAAEPADPTPGNRPVPRLDEQVQGRVVFVNPALRFVVMDFPLRRVPLIDQRLNVYQGSQKVGEVKVTGPVIDTTVAGDLAAGEARVGDEVRED
jgi:hypothetical protein